ncbi:MAG: MATE family efflux transporter [Gammaproteobacteria bacterium]|nr:MATE family efflux transporter [Gammaproteobacteria bacterium]MDH5275032.1 MATE family efflux transporter [Gammaproteobacteria bacterium]
MKPAAGKGARLIEGPVSTAIFSLMVPMLLGMLAIVINNVAGAFFIARVSTEQLAAVSFTFPVSFIVGAIAMSLGIGTSSVVSRLFGSGERDEVKRITAHAMLLAVLCGTVVLIIGLNTIDPLFRLLGADENILPLIHRYMSIYYYGGIFLVAPMIANSVLRASGDAKRPAMIMTTAAALNIAIDPVLIFGLFGFPRMEIAGAALGGVIANAVTLFASAYFVVYREKLLDFGRLAPELIMDSWRQILHVGLPSLTSSLVAPVTTAFITYQIATFGQESVAGFGMASRLEGMSLLAVMSLNGAMTPFVGQNFGAKRLDRVHEAINFSYRFALFYGISVAVVMQLFGGLITDLFGLTGEARHTALLHMHIVPLSYMALGCAMSVNGSLNALRKPMAAMWVSLSRTIAVYAPLAWVLSQIFGIIGIFIAAASANFISGGIGILWLRSTLKDMAPRPEEKPVPA